MRGRGEAGREVGAEGEGRCIAASQKVLLWKRFFRLLNEKAVNHYLDSD